MAQDIRKLFEQERNRSQADLPEGHEDRFLQKLERQPPQKKERKYMLPWLRIAAATIAFFIIGGGGYYAWKQAQADVVDNQAIVDDSSPLVTSPIQEKAFAQGPMDSSKVNVRPGTPKEKPLLTLSDISPDLKKVETYFISTINGEMANLEVTEEEQEMVDAYLIKIKEIGKEYEKLNLELNTIGINEMTITALIDNLKIRLQLLQRLKKKLNHSKKENHEKDSSSNI